MEDPPSGSREERGKGERGKGKEVRVGKIKREEQRKNIEGSRGCKRKRERGTEGKRRKKRKGRGEWIRE